MGQPQPLLNFKSNITILQQNNAKNVDPVSGVSGFDLTTF